MRTSTVLGLFGALLSASAVQATSSKTNTSQALTPAVGSSPNAGGILGTPLSQTVISNTPPACLLFCAPYSNCTRPGDFDCQCTTGASKMQTCLGNKCTSELASAVAYFATRCSIAGHTIQTPYNLTAAAARSASANSTDALRAAIEGNNTITTANIAPSNTSVLNATAINGTAAGTPSQSSDAAAQLATLPRGELVAIVVLATMYLFTV